MMSVFWYMNDKNDHIVDWPVTFCQKSKIKINMAYGIHIHQMFSVQNRSLTF